MLPVENPSREEVRATVLACPKTIYAVGNCAIFALSYPTGLRYTFAYELMMDGVAMSVNRTQMGHPLLQTTNRYIAHIAPKQAIARREVSVC